VETLLEMAWTAASGLYKAVRGHPRSLLRLWQQAVEGAGIPVVESSRRGGLRARAGGLDLHLTRFESGTRVAISGLGHRPHELGLRAESSLHGVERGRARQTEIELGDDAFDLTVSLQGSPELACALFDAETRQVVLRLVEGSFGVSLRDMAQDEDPSIQLRDGELVSEFPSGIFERWPGRSSHVLQALVTAARHLVRPSDLVVALADNFKHEPSSSVRLRILQVLLERFPRHHRTAAVLQDALRDFHDEIRLRAALALESEDARETLLGIAGSEYSRDEHAARAIARLGEQLSVKQVHAILDQALRRRHVATAEACLAQMARRGGGQGLRLLQKVLALEKGALADAAARALGLTGRREAEPALIAALDRHSPETLTAVARALARVGTAAAVAPLRAAADRETDDGFRSAARQAIAAIQARLQGDPGQLSLADDQAGQVSLAEAEDEVGRLSLPDPPKPR
jgi:HEAT repeat protein